MKTAVELFNEEINKLNVGNDARVFIAKLFEQAKEMEKEQIIDAWNTKSKIDGVLTYTDNRTAEQYYNETFKSE
jgi:hypothetical protein